jgi:hypothetical protein
MIWMVMMCGPLLFATENVLNVAWGLGNGVINPVGWLLRFYIHKYLSSSPFKVFASGNDDQSNINKDSQEEKLDRSIIIKSHSHSHRD